MPISFDELVKALPEERRERIEKRAAHLLRDPSELEDALDAEEAQEQLLFDEPMSFLIFKDASGAFRFRLRTKSGATILESPPFPSRPSALAALEAFRRHLEEADTSAAA